MAINFTALNAALKKVIMPSITAQMYERAPMWQVLGGWSAEEQAATRANVNVNRFENNKMYIPIRSSYHSGIVNVGLSEKYRYGQPKLNETYSEIKTMVGSFTIPKQVLNVTDAGAIIKPLVYYSKTLGYDLAMDANRQVYGATITVASAGSSSTTLRLTPSTNGDIDFARYFPEGTYLLIGSNTTPVQVTDMVDDNTLTVASNSLTWSIGDAVVKANGSDAASSELNGLVEMVASSGAYQNLTAAGWTSYVNAINGTVTEKTIRNYLNTAYFKANKTGNVDWIVMNAKAFQTYGESLTDMIRATQKEVLSGGWVGLDYMGGKAKVLLDYDCPDDKIFFLSSEDLVFGEFQPLEFEKGTDGNLLKIAQQLDYEVTASWMGNIGTTARNAHGLLSGCTFSKSA